MYNDFTYYILLEKIMNIFFRVRIDLIDFKNVIY